MASRSPRSDRVEAGSVFQRALSAVRSPFGFNRGPAQRTTSEGDGRWMGRHQGARSSSVGVPGWDTRERSLSARRPSRRPVVITCETCTYQLTAQEAVSCHGCSKGIHAECQDELQIGDLFSVEMCFVCTRKVAHWMRIVEVAERRQVRERKKDSWSRTMIGTAECDQPLSDIGNPVRNNLEWFLVRAIQNGLGWREKMPGVEMENTEVVPPQQPSQYAGEQRPWFGEQRPG